MPTYDLFSLPSVLWSRIISHLNQTEISSLLLTCTQMNSLVHEHVRHELIVTEWASSGSKMIRAIRNGEFSPRTCSRIQVLRVKFTAFDEVKKVLHYLPSLKDKLLSLKRIVIIAYKTEDAIQIADFLSKDYETCDVEVAARAEISNTISFGLSLSHLTSVKVPALLCCDFKFLNSVYELDVKRIIRRGDGSHIDFRPKRRLDRLSVTYADYVLLGRPACTELHLYLEPETEELEIEDAGLRILKLVAATAGYPGFVPNIRAPSLNALILCNTVPHHTVKLFENNCFDSVEFLSIAPVTFTVLRAIRQADRLPRLKQLLVMVTNSSLTSAHPAERYFEKKKLVAYLQTVAMMYPIDVRSVSMIFKPSMFCSEGLWRLTSQSAFSKYLPLVSPPLTVPLGLNAP